MVSGYGSRDWERELCPDGVEVIVAPGHSEACHPEEVCKPWRRSRGTLEEAICGLPPSIFSLQSTGQNNFQFSGRCLWKTRSYCGLQIEAINVRRDSQRGATDLLDTLLGLQTPQVGKGLWVSLVPERCGTIGAIFVGSLPSKRNSPFLALMVSTSEPNAFHNLWQIGCV